MTSLLQTATHRTAGLEEQAPAEPMSCVDMRSYKRYFNCVVGWRGFWWSRGQNSYCKMGCNGLHGENFAAQSYRCACPDVFANFALSVACTK